MTPHRSPSAMSLRSMLATLSSVTLLPLAAMAGPNLLANPGAEAGPVGTTVPSWTQTGSFAVVSYTTGGGFPSAQSPGSPDRAQKFFAGGDGSASSTASQTVDLTAFATTIDSHAQNFLLSGWLGGFSTQNDNCTVSVSFRSASATALGSAQTGPVLATHRNSTTGMLFRSLSGTVPTGTRSAVVTITMTRSEGSYNDGYADDLSFSLDIKCLGDLNNDTLVDDADFSIFAAAYNILDCADPTMPAGCPADLNADAVVDDLDFSIFAVAYDVLLCP